MTQPTPEQMAANRAVAIKILQDSLSNPADLEFRRTIARLRKATYDEHIKVGFSPSEALQFALKL